MKIGVLALLLACAAVATPVAAAAQNTAPAASPRTAQLRAIATYFLPSIPLSDLMIGGIEVTYRDRLEAREDIRALEANYPGIRAAMLAASSRSVRAGVPEMLARLEAEVMAHWDARLSGPEVAAFAALANDPTVAGFTQNGAPVQRGDSVTGALNRVAPRDNAAFQRRMAAFQQTAAGRRLMPMIAAYQAEFGPRMTAAAQVVIQAALAESRRAANAFVRARNPAGTLPFAEE